MTETRSALAVLERDLASAFGVAAAVTTISGSSALLAAVDTLTEPGQEVLVPGWICDTVVNAVVVAHRVPVLLDVSTEFTASTAFADEVLSDATALVCYAPFGGHALDLDAWLQWSKAHGIPMLLDLVSCADVRVWAAASRCAAAITSFGQTKLLGPGGGGALLGDAATVARARRFLRGGRSPTGKKDGVGLELELGESAARSARIQLRRVISSQDDLRAASVRVVAMLASQPLEGWTTAPFALTKVLSFSQDGERLNPDATFRSTGWQTELARRGLTPSHPSPPLATLDHLYDKVRFQRVRPPWWKKVEGSGATHE